MRRQDDEWISMTLTSRGASREPYLKQVMFGEIPGKVARCSPASVLGVKRYEGT
jgi:nucleotide-binding universal stress UspA family protein